MTVFLDPDGRPFFGGTYFPKRGPPGHARASCASWTRSTRRGATAATTCSSRPSKLHDGDRARARRSAPTARRRATRRPTILDARRRRASSAQFDPRFGGFGRAPKFPQAMTLDFLLRTGRARPDARDARDGHGVARRDGRRRHVRPGRRRLPPLLRRRRTGSSPTSRRCSTTRRCSPARTCTAWLVTGEPRYRARRRGDDRVRAARPAPRRRRVLLRRGRRLRGRRGQVLRLVARRDRASCAATTPPRSIRYFGVTAARELRGPAHRLPRQHPARRRPHRGPPGRRSHAALPGAARRARARASGPASTTRCCSAGTRCSCARSPRPPPRSSATTGWTRRARTRGSSSRELRRDDGRLLRSWQDGRAATSSRTPRTTPRCSRRCSPWPRSTTSRGSREARAVADELCGCSPTTSAAAFFTTGTDAEALIVRPKDYQDNATPSENSLAADGLLRLAALTGDAGVRGRARRGGSRTLAPLLGEHPTAFAYLLGALERAGHAAARGRGRRRARRSATAALRREVASRLPAQRRVAVARAPDTGADLTPLLADRATRRRARRPRTCASTTRASSRSPIPRHCERSSPDRARPAPIVGRVRSAEPTPRRRQGPGWAEAVGERLGHRPAVRDHASPLAGSSDADQLGRRLAAEPSPWRRVEHQLGRRAPSARRKRAVVVAGVAAEAPGEPPAPRPLLAVGRVLRPRAHVGRARRAASTPPGARSARRRARPRRGTRSPPAGRARRRARRGVGRAVPALRDRTEAPEDARRAPDALERPEQEAVQLVVLGRDGDERELLDVTGRAARPATGSPDRSTNWPSSSSSAGFRETESRGLDRPSRQPLWSMDPRRPVGSTKVAPAPLATQIPDDHSTRRPRSSGSGGNLRVEALEHVDEERRDRDVADPLVIGGHDVPRRPVGRRRGDAPPRRRSLVLVPVARARRGRSVWNFQFFSGSSIRAWRRARCSSFERWRKTFTTVVPSSVQHPLELDGCGGTGSWHCSSLDHADDAGGDDVLVVRPVEHAEDAPRAGTRRGHARGSRGRARPSVGALKSRPSSPAG